MKKKSINPKVVRSYGQVQTSVLVSSEFYTLCKEHGIQFSNAIRVGIAILLAEAGVKDYDNRLNIVRRAEEYKVKAAKFAQKAADLENGVKKEDN